MSYYKGAEVEWEFKLLSRSPVQNAECIYNFLNLEHGIKGTTPFVRQVIKVSCRTCKRINGDIIPFIQNLFYDVHTRNNAMEIYYKQSS